MHGVSAFTVIEIIGVCSFSMSGSIIGIRKRLDAFGVLVASLFTAFGGGLMRDLLLGNVPPIVFRNYTDLIFCIAFSIIAFLSAYKNKKHFEEDSPIIDKINNIVDAVGLGLFTVIGIEAGIDNGHTDNAPFVIFLGVLTGIGGGMIRDVCIGEIPFVLTKRIYALASIAGGILYYMLLVRVGWNEVLCTAIAVTFIFVIRMLASIFKWDMPKAF